MPKAKGHHFLPRFLLAGFASRIEGSETYAYQFRRGKPPFEANIRDIGKQRFFHGDPAVSDLEERMALEEDRLALQVQDLRCGMEPNPLAAAELITHLIARTKNLRDGLAKAAESLWDALKDLKDSKRFRKQLEKKALREARKVLTTDQRRLFDRMPPAQRTRVIRTFMQSPDAVIALTQVFEALEDFRPRISTMVAEAHNNALARTLFRNTTRINFFATFQWQIRSFQSYTLILGDVGVTGLGNTSEQLVHPLVPRMDDLRCLTLPIDHSRLLVGTRGSPIGLEPDRLNDAMAELSRDFFVASSASGRELGYAGLLAKRSDYVESDDIRKIVLHR